MDYNDGFDFSINESGELNIDSTMHEIKETSGDPQRIQLAISRVKSVASNWFYDNVGANLELVMGKPCTSYTAEVGKNLIIDTLTFDGLWDSNEFIIAPEIINEQKTIKYNVYFKIYQSNSELPTSYLIQVTIDLVKGINIRYGWDSRKDRVCNY